MRRIVLAATILAAAACSSSTGAPTLRQDCEDRFSRVWSSAQWAVGSLGGKVVHASEQSGTILGRIDVDYLGSTVELNITVSRLPGNDPGSSQTVTVSINAVEPSVSDPDEARIEELRRIEEQYLELVGSRAVCGSPM